MFNLHFHHLPRQWASSSKQVLALEELEENGATVFFFLIVHQICHFLDGDYIVHQNDASNIKIVTSLTAFIRRSKRNFTVGDRCAVSMLLGLASYKR